MPGASTVLGGGQGMVTVRPSNLNNRAGIFLTTLCIIIIETLYIFQNMIIIIFMIFLFGLLRRFPFANSTSDSRISSHYILGHACFITIFQGKRSCQEVRKMGTMFRIHRDNFIEYRDVVCEFCLFVFIFGFNFVLCSCVVYSSFRRQLETTAASWWCRSRFRWWRGDGGSYGIILSAIGQRIPLQAYAISIFVFT